MMLAPRVVIGDVDRYADHDGYYWYAKTHIVDGKPVLVHFASGMAVTRSTWCRRRATWW